jgi:hypothetical protein
MTSVQKVDLPSKEIKVLGNLYLPAKHSTDRKYLAVVVSHPTTGVKEQSPKAYSTDLAKAGFDAAYQGERAGEPRYLEDPAQRAEDTRAAVTYLSLRKDVDPARIGAQGICASGALSPLLHRPICASRLFPQSAVSFPAE